MSVEESVSTNRSTQRSPSAKGHSPKGGRPVGEILYGLREARLQADLDAKELAARAGLHEQTIYKLEGLHSGASPRTKLRLAKTLGVSRRILTEEPDTDD